LESRVKERTAELEARIRQSEAQAIELKRSNADLIQFASVASHDLQEPLRTIASYMGILVRRYGGSLDEAAQTYIQFAISGASRMQTLINDLLAYSRVGTQGIAKLQLPFEQIVKRVAEALELMIRENSAKITCGSLPTVEADEVKISQVLQNLIGNAIKFRKPETSPEIRISAERHANEWQFAVADNGIGFDPKYCDRIFEVFQRLHGVGKYAGNGIGLAISRRIIEHHGGRLWAESRPGIGSTFYFTLPALDEHASQHQPSTIVQEGFSRTHVTRSYAS
ncbi:MAG: ATP-binding protein, partial [Acidobacteriota bacterium]|nr:ATP-binding protein [Acidobacteriota bacterium]